ncbi:unnamed protein product [Colias eurytheme]|nr:unnamed protein product [Colias eurytheme]
MLSRILNSASEQGLPRARDVCLSRRSRWAGGARRERRPARLSGPLREQNAVSSDPRFSLRVDKLAAGSSREFHFLASTSNIVSSCLLDHVWQKTGCINQVFSNNDHTSEFSKKKTIIEIRVEYKPHSCSLSRGYT